MTRAERILLFAVLVALAGVAASILTGRWGLGVVFALAAAVCGLTLVCAYAERRRWR